MATIGLFFAVAFWNDYFAAMIYITDPAIKPTVPEGVAGFVQRGLPEG